MKESYLISLINLPSSNTVVHRIVSSIGSIQWWIENSGFMKII